MNKIVFATNNAHKLKELRQILGTVFEVVSLSDIGCHEDIPETGNTLEENAQQKARFVANRYNITCFADDTGLEVEALDGKPGVYTARYEAMTDRSEGDEKYEGDTVSERNMNKLLHKLENNTNRRARFRTVISLLEKQPDGSFTEHSFEGIVNGNIAYNRSGSEGFGYDPIFIPEGYDVTFAQLSSDIKNSISHRGRAVKKLSDYLLQSK